jgi:ketosteroid isomerase-like protein
MVTMKHETDTASKSGERGGSSMDWARCYYDAWNRRDWEWIGAMLAADVEWSNSARDERVKGASAVIASFRSTIEGFPTAMIDLRSTHIAGAVIVAECGIRTGAAPANVRSATFCEVLEIKNGRCIRGTTYADSVRLLMDMSHTAASVAA